jgi:hypothetical protein
MYDCLHKKKAIQNNKENQLIMENQKKKLLFLTVLGYELRTLHLVGKCNTTWATPQS